MYLSGKCPQEFSRGKYLKWYDFAEVGLGVVCNYRRIPEKLR